MRLIKYILITIVSIIGLLLIVAFFVPKTFYAEGKVTINKPIDEVYNYVRFLKTQEDYSVWFQMDPHIKKQYIGEDGIEGAQIIWESEEVGDGKQVIKKLTPPHMVQIDLHLMSPDATPAEYIYELSANASQQTNVKIQVLGTTPYPMNLMSLFFDLNESFQKTAENLKVKLEKN